MEGDSVIARQSLFLTGDFSLRHPDASFHLNRFGLAVEGTADGSPLIAGATIQGDVPELQEAHEMLVEDVQAVWGNNTGFLIGRRPGQVSPWPDECLPASWRPVWAIAMRRRRGTAIFLGERLDRSLPSSRIAGERRSVRAWKRILWHWRKRITPPDLPPLRTLWKDFQEIARNV